MSELLPARGVLRPLSFPTRATIPGTLKNCEQISASMAPRGARLGRRLAFSMAFSLVKMCMRAKSSMSLKSAIFTA